MKRIPLIRSLWHPAARVVQPNAGREVYHIMIGTALIGWSCRGLLSIPGLGDYRPS